MFNNLFHIFQIAEARFMFFCFVWLKENKGNGEMKIATCRSCAATNFFLWSLALRYGDWKLQQVEENLKVFRHISLLSWVGSRT